jgi:TonB family protein
LSATLVGPAGPLAGAPASGPRLPRLYAAIGFALAMHAALLALGPGGVAGSHVAPAAKAMAMAVRMVRPLAPPELAPAPVPSPPDVVPNQSTEPARPAPEQATPPLRTAKPSHDSSVDAAAAAVKSRPAEHSIATPSASATPAVATPSAATPAPTMPSTADEALPAAPDYAFGVRLDPGPRPLDDIEPKYPDPHFREGTVVLRLLISETGHVDNVAVVRSQPRGVFEQAALDAFGTARFAPGLAAGMPVKSQITVEVRFVPINRGARVSGRSY